VTDPATWSPRQFRDRVASGAWNHSTTGVCLGYTQANLAVMSHEYAFDFLLFCQRNQQACPVLDVVEPGAVTSELFAPGADLRTELPRYRVYREGDLVDERTEVTDLWPEEAVAFLLGCALSCDEALLEAGVPVRHLEDGMQAPVYLTDHQMVAAGRFAGPLAVNMRPVPAGLVARAAAVTSRFPSAHGGPMHIGDPAGLGIRDLADVRAGAAPSPRPGDVPVFWACGVSAELAARRAELPLMITHAPGHMFVTDRPSGLEATC
jgi:uncharacterized protein YcsI (UPF0317 family)